MKHGTSMAAALAAAVALPSLRNGYVYDDVLLVLQNSRVHGLAQSGALWHSSYWPAGLLYRPLTTQLFAFEWALGNGNPLPFHLVTLLLAALSAALLFRLARQLLPDGPALLAAALFAVHPVHVEVLASVVGQGELLAAVAALLAVERYLAWSADAGLTAGRRWLLAGVTLLGILAKETGYVIPLLLGAAALTVRRGRREERGSLALLQGTAVLAGLLLRVSVLGSLAGETPAAVLRGLGAGARALAMLAVAPQWARLLLWPARLQVEYGPPALPVDPALGRAQLAGLLLLGVTGLALGWSWSRRPVLAFGLLWLLLALLPVSNLIAPTGILLAERVLYLPSVGLVLGIGAMAEAVWPRFSGASRAARLAVAVAVLALLALGGVATLRGQAPWRSQQRFFAELERTAAGSYRAQFVVSRYYYGERRYGEAEAAARRALALYGKDPQVHEQLGQVLRVEGRCAEALPILAEGVRLAPDGTTLRSRLIECALQTGDTARARDAAREAVRLGQREFQQTLDRLGGRP